MNIAAARRIAGSLGFPLKMPGTSYGLPAKKCVTGSKLAAIHGSVCSKCYALKDRHAFANPAKAQERRLASISNPRWVDAMVSMLLKVHSQPTFRIDMGVRNAKARGLQRFRFNVSGFHRWHDSGDIQSVDHLSSICEVARRTPKIKHWLPTQELGIVKAYLTSGGVIPQNLTIRVSSVMIETGHFNPVRRSWPQTSSVFKIRAGDDAHVCPAPHQGGVCGSCRACWSRDVAHVAYELH